MAYTDNKKSTGLETQTTLADADLVVHGDSSDSGRAKAITWANLKTQIQTAVEAFASYFNVSSDTSDAITEGSTNLFLTTAERTKLTGIETAATADQSDAEIETAYNNQVSVVSQAIAEAGTSTTVYRWTPQRVAQAIAALSGALGDMTKAVYDTNNDGIVDEAAVITSQGALATLDTVSTTEIDDTAVTFAKMQDIATNRILGRSTAGTGSPEALADAAARTIMGLATSDSPQFTAVNIGHATDTTVGRTSAGRINVEGTDVVLVGDNVSGLTNDAGYLTSYTETDPVVGAINGLVKANGLGTISAAVANTDYQSVPAEGAFANGDKTKLDGIETGADVTDTTNVTAAGALMDSELADLTAIKTLQAPDNTTISTFAATVLDDTTAGDARTTLGAYGSGDSPTFGVITYTQATATPVNLGNLGATETIDFAAGHEQYGTLDSNVNITHSNEVSGRTVNLYLAYDGTAQRTITWSAVDKWLDGNNGSAPATPSASGDVLVVTLKFIGTTCYASATGNYAVY